MSVYVVILPHPLRDVKLTLMKLRERDVISAARRGAEKEVRVRENGIVMGTETRGRQCNGQRATEMKRERWDMCLEKVCLQRNVLSSPCFSVCTHHLSAC